MIMKYNLRHRAKNNKKLKQNVKRKPKYTIGKLLGENTIINKYNHHHKICIYIYIYIYIYAANNQSIKYNHRNHPTRTQFHHNIHAANNQSNIITYALWWAVKLLSKFSRKSSTFCSWLMLRQFVYTLKILGELQSSGKIGP
ncbi:hypothetical protein ACOSQ2_000271 [Xanthoceras sorbifolium]